MKNKFNIKFWKTNVTILKIFFSFLRKHGCFESYLTNLSKTKKTSYDCWWDANIPANFDVLFNAKTLYDEDLLSRRYGINLINSAFFWSNTTEGFDYWKRLDMEWRCIFRGFEVKRNKKVNY